MTRLLRAALLLLLLPAGAACDSGAPPPPEPPEPGSLDAALYGEPGLFEVRAAVAAPDQLTFALVQRINERMPGFNTDEEVWALTLDRRDGRWTAARVSTSPDPERHPALAHAPDGTTHLLWAETTPPHQSWSRALWHATRAPGAGAFTAPRLAWRASPRVGSYLAGLGPAALLLDPHGHPAGAPRALFTAEFDDDPHGPRLALLRAPGPAGPWAPAPERLEPRALGQAHAAALPDGGLGDGLGGDGLVAVAVQRLPSGVGERPTERVVALASPDGGATWGPPVPVAELGDEAGYTYLPRVAAGPGGSVHATWLRRLGADAFPDEVWHAASADGGRTWGPAAAVGGSGGGDLTSPAYVAVGPGGVAHLVYYWQPYFAAREGNALRHAVWAGSGWAPQGDLTTARIVNGVVGVATDAGGCVHALWNEADVGELADGGIAEPTALVYRRVGPCAD